MTQGLLSGMLVVDSTDGRGELCARILADLGADVVKVEPPGGASSRQHPPFAPDGTSLSFAVRNTNKASVVLDLDDAAGRDDLHRLLARADVWVESSRPGDLAARDLDHAAVVGRHPHLVLTSITDFGLTGPYRDHVATDDVLVALAGVLCRSGVPGRPPLLPPGSMAHDVASTTAAFATLAACWQRRRTGRGQHVDLSVLEALAQTTDWSLPNWSVYGGSGGTGGQVRSGSGPVYPLYPCADGYVRLVVLSPRQWRAMRAWLGEPEHLQDSAWDQFLTRLTRADVLDPLYRELFADRTAAELAAEAQERGIVMTPVLSPAQVLSVPHYRERGTLVEAEVAAGVRGPLASGFFEVDGDRAGYRARAPRVGEHQDEVPGPPTPARRRPAPVGPAEPSYPFEDLRVLDFGHGGVGVETGRLLAEYGADVVKIESRTYPDFIRTVAGSEMSASFASSSRVKRSFGVNVKTEEGLALARRLVAWADVIIENGSTGTMADMGLDWETVHRLNPGVVMVSSQLMGSRGPWKDWKGYGPSTRPAGGMTWLWNFDDGGMPPGAGVIYPDHLVGRMAAVGAVAALLGREGPAGRGTHVEVAQVETVVGMLADLFLRESLDPGSVRPRGNRSEWGAPWGVYPCRGEERWCVVTVRDDAEWERLRRALGEPAWTRDPDLASAPGRRARADELDAHLAAWTCERTDDEVMATLQAAGVPAGTMLYAADVASDPHYVARGYPQPVSQPGAGALVLEGPAFRATGMPEPIVAPAPGLGEHTREIAREVLGLADGEVDGLVARGVLEIPLDGEG